MAGSDCTERADAVRGAWAARSGAEPYITSTPQGEVRIRAVDTATGTPQVMVYVEGGDEGLFRIVNPPVLVEDPAGDVVAGGARFRRDPLQAVAQVIARHGGAVRPKGRRG